MKKASVTSLAEKWSVAEFSDFYIKYRSRLVSHADRLLKDKARAEEVAQEAVIKFMLASPELLDENHALAYLHKSIENLCIDIFRLENRRPNLVALDDVTSEIESQLHSNEDHSNLLAAAEDAAIVRQALALLSPSERAALIMWEMEGRSTEEIAKELGIKKSAVRHTVSRARTSLRKILSTLIIDEKRNLTALDLLNVSYKNSKELVRKSGRVVMSAVVLLSAFFGFNSLIETNTLQVNTGVKSDEILSSTAQSVHTEQKNQKLVDKQLAAPSANQSSDDLNSAESASLELDFYNSQLETAASMLEAMLLIEGKK